MSVGKLGDKTWQQQADEIAAELVAAHADFMARCTCPGRHDDEAECPCSPPCTCGTHFNPFCPRDGDPEPLS